MRKAGDRGESDRSEPRGKVGALAELVEEPCGEDADEEYNPEHRLLGGEPSPEQPADGNAESDPYRRAKS